MSLIADEKLIYRSPCPQDLFCYSPWLTEGFNNRLMLSFDLAGPGLPNEPGPKSDYGDFGSNQCRIYVSDDHGESWRHTGSLPMLHARVFKAGNAMYLLGHSGRLIISKSTDNGETWSDPSILDDINKWHQAPCAIDYRHGKIYLTMEHEPLKNGWAGGDPVLMSAEVEKDLTNPENWTFSNKLEFQKVASLNWPNAFGFSPVCWLESNVTRIYDKEHELYDPEDKTVLILSRVHSNQNNYAAMLLGRENEDGSLTLDTVKASNGSPWIYFPFPGGHMKFHIAWDEPSLRYWLIASQSEYNLAERNGIGALNSRRRLALYFSTDMFNWSFAGMVGIGPCPSGSRHYASLMIDGDDILVLSRSGDEQAKNAHDTNMITLHRVKNFRELVY